MNESLHFKTLTDRDTDQAINELEPKETRFEYRLIEHQDEDGETFTTLLSVSVCPDGSLEKWDDGAIWGWPVLCEDLMSYGPTDDLKTELQAMLLAFDKPTLPLGTEVVSG